MIATPQFTVSNEEYEGLLARYTRDITAFDKAGKFDPVTGRDEEIDLMTLILLQRLRKNVLLLGGAGVGKTALFIGLAQWINAGKVPSLLKGARLIELEMSVMGAGSQSRADLEGRLIPIIKGTAERNALHTQPPIIFCIDEVHQLMLSFKASSFGGVIDVMKPYLTAGDLYVIGATTREEYEDYVKTDPAIDRRFQKIFLNTPDLAITHRILMGMKGNFEKHYGIEISREACAKIITLTDRFLRTRNNPDKSILALDLACARAVKKGVTDRLDDESIELAVAAEAGIDPAALRS
ncbi:MAG: AAA family ATPase [Alphaproteobacteria bacterium]|nr:AAA family ATPase [Alphaproteobacteria bacterium]